VGRVEALALSEYLSIEAQEARDQPGIIRQYTHVIEGEYQQAEQQQEIESLEVYFHSSIQRCR
jgi:hypothetical protein